MRRLVRTPASVSIACMILISAVPSVCQDLVGEAVGKVSQSQYRAYQVDIENMGLGLYGGPMYDQGYRSRDGWIGGGTLGNEEARLYLTDQFTSMGLDVSIQGDYRNVVAELSGTGMPQDIYIVCAHYDTTSGGERPGGDDNASGTAGVLEAARVLTQYGLDSTVRFIAFNAEEDWMLGSQEYVDKVVVAGGENVVGVLNLDMILRPGWDTASQQPIDLDIETGPWPGCFDWAHTFTDAAALYVPVLVTDPAAPDWIYWDAGDQGPFIAAGYPALMISEATTIEIWSGRSNAYYHNAQDASDVLANDASNPSGVTYDYAFAADVVKAAVATLALEGGLARKPGPRLCELQRFPAICTHDLGFVSIGDDQYIAVSDSVGGSTIYRWDGASFAEFQPLSADNVADHEPFLVEGESYLAVASAGGDPVRTAESQIFKWDGAAFVVFQSIPTSGAADWEAFAIEGDSYLAVANSSDGLTSNIDSKIYRWDGSQFVEFQSIPSSGAHDWEAFSLDGGFYLALANTCDDTTYSVDSRIYKWTTEGFAEFQSIPTHGAIDWEFFHLEGQAYLVVANMRDDETFRVDSAIYQWDGARFVQYQRVPTDGAVDCEFFVIDGESYLAMSETQGGDCRVFRWNGARFVESMVVPACGITDLEWFTVDGNGYMGIACDAKETTDGSASAIYRYEPLSAEGSGSICGGDPVPSIGSAPGG